MDTAVSDKNALARSIEQVTVRWFLWGIGGWTSPVVLGFPLRWPPGTFAMFDERVPRMSRE
jgi:hypothetical protein